MYFKLEFPSSNSETESKALVIGLIYVLQMGIHRFCAQGDSRMIIKQEFALRVTAPVSYQTAIQKLIKCFSSIPFKRVSRVHNKYVDALATLASKVDIPDEMVDLEMMKWTVQANAIDLVFISFDEQDLVKYHYSKFESTILHCGCKRF